MDGSLDDPHDPATWPTWATEPIALAEPDASWPAQARAHGAELADLLDGAVLGRVEHVGSTAVPGLPAKPVLDLAARLPDPATWCTWHATTLTHRGWHLVPPELDADRHRRLLVRVDETGRHRQAHLHLLWPHSTHLHDVLAFRDRLRADPALAARYAELKRASAAAHRDDREAYTASKAEFVAQVLGRAP